MSSLVALVLASMGLAAIGLGSAQAQAQPATTARVVELALPRAVSANEAVDLEVQTGVMPRGTEIDVTTPSGGLLGTISPFAIPPGHPAGTYTIPLSASDIVNGHVTVQLSLKGYGIPPRPPTASEVRNVSIGYTRTSP
jgi:hypothetical protein